MAPRLNPSSEAELRAASFSYREVGRTRGAFPTGYRRIERRRQLTPDAFEVAIANLLCWRIHQRAGLDVHASSDVIADAVVVLHLGWGPVQVQAPCRVVYTINEAQRRGFAYGTLPGHPEAGEEAFIIERESTGAVTFTIRAFSKPATALARIAGPVGHWVQNRITDRYLNSAEK
jgi:uncharacterized protein (UPF0548 family)